MRRQGQEITDRAEIEAILQQASVCRLAMCDGDLPYIVPLSFGYRDGCLYFHSAAAGRKVDLLRRNNRVCFEVDIAEEVLKKGPPCAWSVRYRSVIGWGRAFFLEEREDKVAALDVIVAHYGGPAGPYTEAGLAKAAVIRIEIEEMAGKRSPAIVPSEEARVDAGSK